MHSNQPARSQRYANEYSTPCCTDVQITFVICLIYLVSSAPSLTCLERVLQKKDALQTEFDELNHMLTHQPPSAWAKREKKYHDDKKLWDSAQAELTGKVKRLNEEVKTLKDNNRAVILQEQLQVQ